MTLAEIIALSKAGYKKKDIDALIADEAAEKGNQPEGGKADPEADPDEKAADPDDKQADPKADPEADPEGGTEEKPAKDYEALYKDTLKKLETLQGENSKRDLSPESDISELEKLVTDFID